MFIEIRDYKGNEQIIDLSKVVAFTANNLAPSYHIIFAGMDDYETRITSQEYNRIKDIIIRQRYLERYPDDQS